MKKVLITGAVGYIGKHVTKKFLDEGYDVYVSDFTFKGIDERAKRIEVPIFSRDKDIFNKVGRPDILVHLAWRDGFVHNSDAHMNDLSEHYIFLKNMIDGGLKSLSVMGSMHEVGYWEGAIDEKTPCNPLSMYGIAKNALRQALMFYCENKDISIHWLRAYYIYGDDSRGSSIFAKLYQAEQDGKEEFPFTTGKNLYDFIHIEQLAAQIMYASVQCEINGIINVCSGNPVSLADKIETYIKENNMKIKLKYGAFPDRPYDSPGTWGDNSKIQEIMDKVKRDVV